MAVLRRQGDLLFKLIDEIPKNTVETEGTIVALGEQTGHKHNAKGGLVQLYKTKNNPNDLFAPKVENPDQINFIEVKLDTIMEHEEHKPIPLPKGKYAVVHEREYNPFALEAHRIRQVLD